MTKKVFEEGLYDISNDDYHSCEGVSRSALWTFKELPKKYWYQYLSGEYERPKQSDAYLVGNMVHTKLLEPHLFDSLYIVNPDLQKLPDAMRLKDVGRELFDKNKADRQAVADSNKSIATLFESESIDKDVVTSQLLQQASDMDASLRAQQVVCDVIQDAKCEQSIFWRDSETGMMCKARPDIWNNPLCADLKTTEDASGRGFQLSAMKYGYFMQAAMIHEALSSIGEPFDKFLFVCVEKKKPYSVGMYLLDDDALQFGIKEFHATLRRFADCKEKNNWPDYGIQTITVPRYATTEI